MGLCQTLLRVVLLLLIGLNYVFDYILILVFSPQISRQLIDQEHNVLGVNHAGRFRIIIAPTINQSVVIIVGNQRCSLFKSLFVCLQNECNEQIDEYEPGKRNKRKEEKVR